MRTGRTGCSILIGALAILLPSNPAGAANPFRTATRLSMAGDYEGALKEYESFVDRHPSDRLAPLAVLAAGNLCLEIRNDDTRATQFFERVIREYPSSPWASEAARRRGEAFRRSKDWRRAGDSFEQALALAAGTGNRETAEWVTSVTADAAECFHEMGDNPRVLELYRKVLDGSPAAETAATALFRMGEACQATGRPQDAARSYVRILEECPCASGDLLPLVMQKRDLIDAEKPIDWKPYETYEDISQLLRRRDVEGALAACREMAKRPSPPAILECLEYRTILLETRSAADFSTGERRMQAYANRYPGGQLAPDAEATLDQWAEIIDAENHVGANPEDPGGLATLGSLYLYAGSFGPALALLEKARDLDPESFGTRFSLGFAYMVTGASEAAIREFEIYLESYPTDYLVRGRVGRLYMNGEAYDEAASHFRKVVDVMPEDPGAYDSLGEALFRAGRLEEAARACERAVELDAERANPQFYLGKIYRRTGEAEKSVAAFERFLERAPEGEFSDEARAALDELRKSKP